MIVILKHEARQEQIDRLKQFLLGMGLRIDESKGENSTILGLVGDTPTSFPRWMQWRLSAAFRNPTRKQTVSSIRRIRWWIAAA